MKLIGLLSKNLELDSPAIITKEYSLTYVQFENKLASMMEELTKLGVRKNNRVAVVSDNSLEFIEVIFSLWRLGAVPVPVNVRLLPKEIEEIVSFARCSLLLTSKSFKESNEIKIIPAAVIPEGKSKSKQKFDNDIDFNINNTAVIIFTSGSTGKPKGVEISFNNLIQSAVTGDKIFKHKQGDRWLASLPFYHVGGFSIITRCFFFGAALIIPESLEMEHLKFAIENFNPTLTSFVSTQLKRLIESGCKPNNELRHVLLGGGFIDPSLVKSADEKGWIVSKSYGTTETCSFVTALTGKEFINKPQSAGKAIPPNQILILDDKKKSLPAGVIGEIAVKAHSVALRYFDNVEESKKKFNKDIFYSGDYGYLDEDGYLFVEVRREDLIVSGGENINPAEVEKELLTHPNVLETCVFGIEDKEWGQAIAAAVVTKNGKEISFEELKKYLKDKLPAFKHPKKIFFLDKLPRTELGKVLKEKVKEMIR